jgi:4-hydroxy-tetrahydrodipicolinate synthase
MTRDRLHRFVPAAVTPFSETGEIMWDAFTDVLDFLVGRGASAMCIAGDSGESWALSAAERWRLVRYAKDHLSDDTPILMGISAPTMSSVADYIAAAAENGADALLSMPPTYVLKATDAELANRFEQIRQAADLPIVLYNWP